MYCPSCQKTAKVIRIGLESKGEICDVKSGLPWRPQTKTEEGADAIIRSPNLVSIATGVLFLT